MNTLVEKSKENNPPVSEVSRDVANLTERKKMPTYMVSVCLSVYLLQIIQLITTQ